MIKAQILSKSGDNGWYDYDGCDYIFGTCELEVIPPIGAKLFFNKGTKNERVFVIKEVEIDISNEFENFYNIYVYELTNNI